MPDKISEVLQSREKWGRNIITVVIVAALVALGFYYWGIILPFLIDTVFNTIRLAIGCIVLVVLGFLVFDPRMRTLWTYAYASLTRAVLQQFIDIDAIGILKTYVARLKARLREMTESIGNLQGQRDELADFIAKNEEERIHELQRAKTAKKIVDGGGEKAANMRGELALHGRQAGRLAASNKTLSAVLAREERLLVDLKTLRDSSAVLVTDIENEVNLRIREKKMADAATAAVRAAQRIMAAGGPEKELYDETLERLADSFSKQMGQIDYFMEASKSMINGAALDNMAYEDSAIAELEKWEKEEAGTGLSVPPITGPSTAPPPAAPAATKYRVEEPGSFDSLFDEGGSKGGQSGQGSA